MNNNQKENTFICIDENGNHINCKVLFTFDLEKTGKNYIIYTDNTKDENGNIRTYASTFNPDLQETELGAIKTEEEWKLIEGILNTLATKEGNEF